LYTLLVAQVHVSVFFAQYQVRHPTDGGWRRGVPTGNRPLVCTGGMKKLEVTTDIASRW